MSQIKTVNWLNEEKDFCFHSKYLADTKIMNAKSKGDIFNLAYFRAIQGIKQASNLEEDGICIIH